MSRFFTLLALWLLTTPAAAFDKAALAWTLPWDADWVTAVVFTGPKTLAVGNKLGQILVYELPDKMGGMTPLPLRRLDGHTNTITRLLATPDGRWLISSSYDHTIRYWDLLEPGSGKDKIVLNARTREDLIRRKSSKIPAEITVEVSVQKAAKVLEGHKDWVVGMSLSLDAGRLLSGDDAGNVFLWDRPNGKEVQRWKVKGWAYAVALSPDSKQALVSEQVPLVFDSGRHAGIKLWDATTGKMQHDLEAQFKGMFLSAAAYAPDGKTLVVGRGGEVDGNNGKLFFIDPVTGRKGKELTPGHQYGVTDLVFHPDGKHVASAGRDTLVRIWSVPEGKLVKELGKSRGGQFKDWICAVAFSPDARWLAAADMAGAVQVWALDRRE